jgi:hypothetical protein
VGPIDAGGGAHLAIGALRQYAPIEVEVVSDAENPNR